MHIHCTILLFDVEYRICMYSEVDGHTQPLAVTNLTMYGTPPISAVIFGIGDGVESAKMSLLAKFHAQLSVWRHGRFHKHIRELIKDLIIA